MSQNSLVIPNTGTLSGLALVNDANAALDSLNTLNSGGSAPSTTEADMWWMDTTNGLLKQRNAANSAWLVHSVRGVAAGGGIAHSGIATTITGNTTLTTAWMGEVVPLNPSAPITITLPVANTFPVGYGFILDNGASSTYSVTIAPQGTDTTNMSTLGPGDQVFVFSDGVGNWRGVGQSRVLSQSLSSSGYAKLTGGLILQWGGTGASVSGGSTVTYPITFPNAVYGTLLTLSSSGADFPTLLSGGSNSAFNFAVWNTSGSSIAGLGCFFVAFGR
ncbi:gp53-like domain-containing protein [Paraburkholderia sp.]|uniref:gp53-like domain-containing protein n=1 Tax=Paraburkholderia sp. TaxID=1926495 RepID=UPI003C7A4BAC